MEEAKPQRLYKGLHTDNSYQDQPEGTLSFALNCVNESETGDVGFPGNEQSNEECGFIKEGFIILGSIYIGNGETVIFSVSYNESISEIGIQNNNCLYQTFVNDESSESKLGFKKHIPITGTYRIRRGCERTIYIVTPTPMVYNFDKPKEFKKLDDNGNIINPEQWDFDRFKLFKTYRKVPRFGNVEILETGQLRPGSYNYSIQLLDADLNPTEFIVSNDTIIINNDNIKTKPFHSIRGSTGKKTSYQDFGLTNKAIKISFYNLDKSYLFYRVGIIAANNGTGLINDVFYSSEIPIQNNTFTYDGTNHAMKGTEEEIQQFNNVIASAKNIAQIENRLVLSNTKGKQIDFCKFQKYASKIKTDLVTKRITLNNINVRGNPKRNNVHNEWVGYMPGEIYSLAVVYVLEEFGPTPSFHIPGKNPVDPSSTTMAGNNEIESYYTKNTACEGGGWFSDYMGLPITPSTKVRHHRFPLRSEIKDSHNNQIYPLFRRFGGDIAFNTYAQRVKLLIYINGTVANTNTSQVTYIVNYTENGINRSETRSISIVDHTQSQVYNTSIDDLYGLITNISVTETSPTGSGLNYGYAVEKSRLDESNPIYTSDIFGFKFSNVLPRDNNGNIDLNVRNDKGDIIDKIIGYYIVRNERTEANKTILDTCVTMPTTQEFADTGKKGFKFVTHGQLLPDESPSDGTNISKYPNDWDIVAFINPEFKFNRREYTNITSFIHQGIYYSETKSLNSKIVDDVQPGTSYDPDRSAKHEKDTDGWDLHLYLRNNAMRYTPRVSSIPGVLDRTTFNEVSYLDVLFSKSIKRKRNGERVDVYNLSADNRIGIMDFQAPFRGLDVFVMKRELSNPYSEFRTLPYYPDTQFIKADVVNDSIEVFGGDSYISSMKYMSSIFYDVRLRNRDQNRPSWWEIVLGVYLTVGGVVGAVFTAGATLPLAYLGIQLLLAGYKQEQAAKVYQELYKLGLKDTVKDKDTDTHFKENPPDDEIQWFHDVLEGLFFESSVNMNWRMGNSIGMPDFLDSPTGYVPEDILQYCVDKLTILDAAKNSGRNYQGVAKPEVYEVNPDYLRRNKGKIFHHLPLEYDCCSNCRESFPGRVHVSEQSFQEELTDNYRKFLPNNYIDIAGETGKITNMFTLGTDLYIHTAEALWHLPNQHQERVTGDIVSFIGTGSFLAIPPRKIIDSDTGMSAGCIHKLATVKTPLGVIFPSERQRTMFIFDGQRLRSINGGMNNWLKNNMPILFKNPSINGFIDDEDYPISQMPMYLYDIDKSGAGYIAVHDSRKERMLITKRDFVRQDGFDLNNSWTLSYNLKNNSWESFMSYRPGFYFSTPEKFYSCIPLDKRIWKHNVDYKYLSFYNSRHDFIIEYVSLSNPLITKINDAVTFMTEAKKFDYNKNIFVDQKFVAFKQAVFYNSRQCSGLKTLIVKDQLDPDYIMNQIRSTTGAIIISRNERNWNINELRDMRINYDVPMFDKNLFIREASGGFIDKVLNNSSINVHKDWKQREPFRDKYLVIRLMFSTFDNVKLIMNYCIDDEKQSYR